MRCTSKIALVAVALLATLHVPAASAAAGGLSPDEQRAYARVTVEVAKRGWACHAVTGKRPDDGFAYSIGLASKHLPELGVFATGDLTSACSAIDRVARALIVAGRSPRSGAEVFHNADGRVVLRAVLHQQFFAMCVLARRWRDEHHIADARAMQLVVLGPTETMPP